MNPVRLGPPKFVREVYQGRKSDRSDGGAVVRIYCYCVAMLPIGPAGVIEFEAETDSLTDAEVLTRAREAMVAQGFVELEEEVDGG